jgi:aspartyl-tRNA(Asn)/glutamyl-tRNA(Gln) amidotransferase subunit A
MGVLNSSFHSMPPFTDADLPFATIEEIARLFRQRKLSPVELTKLILSRTDQLNPKLNAYITVTAELALTQAKKAEAELFAPRGRKGSRDRGLLHGIPISLKDNICTAGIRTTAGSKILKDFIPKEDAAVVGQLKNAGAIILGKTNLHEFAYGVTSNNPHYGPVHNPWDLSRIPGGSSGGSAAAVAAGLCYGSIGTDTGGSIRIPAALCGTVGLKPHFRRVSTQGVVPLSRSLDHVGPLARTVVDAALILRAITSGGYIDGSAHKTPYPFKFQGVNEIRKKLHRPIHVGLPDYFWNRIDDEVRTILMKALAPPKSEIVCLHEYRAPGVHGWTEPSTNIALAEATAFHQSSGWFPLRSAEYGEDVRTRLEMGGEIRATDYIASLAKRPTAWISLFDHRSDFVGLLDAIVTPVTPFSATEIGVEAVSINGESEKVRAALLRLNRPANFAELPAISVPCGFTPSGLPVGLQIIGHGWQEKSLLQFAHAFERVHPQTRRPPNS